jgi:hypothetical protein
MHLPSGVGSVRDVIKDTVRSGWPQYGMEWDNGARTHAARNVLEATI